MKGWAEFDYSESLREMPSLTIKLEDETPIAWAFLSKLSESEVRGLADLCRWRWVFGESSC